MFTGAPGGVLRVLGRVSGARGGLTGVLRVLGGLGELWECQWKSGEGECRVQGSREGLGRFWGAPGEVCDDLGGVLGIIEEIWGSWGC